jgi:Tfp pilus assembly protein FimT
MRSRLLSKRGFSLIQVILALQLAVITAAIGVVKMNAFAAQFQLMRGSSQLAFDITKTRAQAIAQNRSMRIKVLSATTYQRQKKNPSTGVWDVDTPTTNATKSLPKGITITSASLTAVVTFETTGYAKTTETNNIVMQNALSTPLKKTIQTTPLGKVNVING